MHVRKKRNGVILKYDASLRRCHKRIVFLNSILNCRKCSFCVTWFVVASSRCVHWSSTGESSDTTMGPAHTYQVTHKHQIDRQTYSTQPTQPSVTSSHRTKNVESVKSPPSLKHNARWTNNNKSIIKDAPSGNQGTMWRKDRGALKNSLEFHVSLAATLIKFKQIKDVRKLPPSN